MLSAPVCFNCSPCNRHVVDLAALARADTQLSIHTGQIRVQRSKIRNDCGRALVQDTPQGGINTSEQGEGNIALGRAGKRRKRQSTEYGCDNHLLWERFLSFPDRGNQAITRAWEGVADGSRDCLNRIRRLDNASGDALPRERRSGHQN